MEGNDYLKDNITVLSNRLGIIYVILRDYKMEIIYCTISVVSGS